jgi:hypothetical protein
MVLQDKSSPQSWQLLQLLRLLISPARNLLAGHRLLQKGQVLSIPILQQHGQSRSKDQQQASHG